MEVLMASPHVAGVTGVGVNGNASVSLAPLARSPHVRRLDALSVNGEGLRMTPEDWGAFRLSPRFDALRALSFSTVLGEAGDAFVDLALKLADRLEELTVSSLHGRTAELLSALASFPRLRRLGLRSCALVDADLDRIAALGAPLAHVDLGNNHFHVQAMERFRRNPRWAHARVVLTTLLPRRP
jgi:hypothetical protein